MWGRLQLIGRRAWVVAGGAALAVMLMAGSASGAEVEPTTLDGTGHVDRLDPSGPVSAGSEPLSTAELVFIFAFVAVVLAAPFVIARIRGRREA